MEFALALPIFSLGNRCCIRLLRYLLALSLTTGASFYTLALASAVTIHVPQSAPNTIVLFQANVNLNTQAQIYLLRGLANVFSRGMDEMAAKLRQQGFAPTVMNHRSWQSAADTIGRNYRGGQKAPIILIGHSLGANAAFRMGKRLDSKNIQVDYLATFDPTQRFSVPRNVRSFANFYQSNGVGRAASFPASRQEDKVNLNLTSSPGLTHTNIDQSTRLQDIVIARILQVTAK